MPAGLLEGPTRRSTWFRSSLTKIIPVRKQDDVLIEDGDVVTVQGTGGFVNNVQVSAVKGAVNHPGPVIMTGKTMRLSDALAAAGGLRPEAFASGAEFYRIRN